MELPLIRVHKQGRVLAQGQDDVLQALVERIGISPFHTKQIGHIIETGQVNLLEAVTVSEELERRRCAVSINFDPERMLTFILGTSTAL